MSDMVERVARAIFEDAEAQMVAEKQLDQARDWNRIFPWFRNSHIQYARAAIAAMREPTKAMLDNSRAYGGLIIGADAGDDGDVESNISINEDWAVNMYRLMIDGALK